LSRPRSRRVAVIVTREMTVALDVLCSKSGLTHSTQAMVLLRQSLDRTIESAAVQTRLSQERAFRTRDQWLLDQGDEAMMTHAIEAVEGTATDAPPA
jgi:hypothetical protein